METRRIVRNYPTRVPSPAGQDIYRLLSASYLAIAKDYELLAGKLHQPHGAPGGFQFFEAEVAQLLFKANNPAKEKLLLRVKFSGIPGPVGIRGKELHLDHRIRDIFLRIERRELFPYLLQKGKKVLVLIFSNKFL